MAVDEEFVASNPDFASFVENLVLTMPAAKHYGFSFGMIEPGRVQLVQPHRQELTEHNGFFQGGVLGALIDFAGGSASATLLPPGWVNMTIDYTVKIVAPARGEMLRAYGDVIKAGQVTTAAKAEVYAVREGREKLSATGLVTMRNLPLNKE